MRETAILLSLIILLVGTSAAADCCRIIKVDPETPPVQLRVCEPDLGGACGNILLLGTLALGESETVCSSGETVVYEEFDEELAEFGPPVEAICAGDVEL